MALLVAAGQAGATPAPPALELSTATGGVAEEPTSQPRQVYELHLAVDIPVTIVAGSVGLIRAFFADELARKSCPCDPSGLNALDRGTVGNHSAAAGVAANVTVYGVMAALPLADLLDLGFGRALGQDLMVYAETLAVDTALQNATNFIVARPRPRTYAGDAASLASGDGYLSFYAGHVATAFAMTSVAAVTIRARYGERIWPWIVGGLIASSVAVERVASGDHFPTDVAVAALVGTGIGITVPWLHLRQGDIRAQLAPVGANGLGLVGTF